MSESIMTILPAGTINWKNKAGEFHRLDGPAIEWANNSKEWYQNNNLHRLDGPAIEYDDGSKFWYQNGKLHRIDGPAIEHANGSKEWYQNGMRHRIDGPAIDWIGYVKRWYYFDDYLGADLEGFWKLWEFLDEEGRQNVNLHTWLVRLTNV